MFIKTMLNVKRITTWFKDISESINCFIHTLKGECEFKKDCFRYDATSVTCNRDCGCGCGQRSLREREGGF